MMGFICNMLLGDGYVLVLDDRKPVGREDAMRLLSEMAKDHAIKCYVRHNLDIRANVAFLSIRADRDGLRLVDLATEEPEWHRPCIQGLLDKISRIPDYREMLLETRLEAL